MSELPSNYRHSRFQLDLRSPSVNPEGMVDTVMGDLRKNRIYGVLHLFRNLRATERPESFSLTDIQPSRISSEENNPVFAPVIGSVLMQGGIEDSPMETFYTPARIHRQDDGTIGLRGANYFINFDKYRATASEKMAAIGSDLRDGFSVMEQVERPKTEREYLMYLGVLDYIKAHSLSIFHAVTAEEKNNNIPPTGREREDYIAARKKAERLMTFTNRRFYQAVLGLPFDSINIADIAADSEELLLNMQKTTDGSDLRTFAHYPEVVNPLTIILGAHEAALKNQDIDTVVGLASGGTESAVAVQLCSQYLTGKAPQVAVMPLSFHSRLHKGSRPKAESVSEMMQAFYPDAFAGKSILLVDDNANSGKTLTAADTIVQELGAVQTNAHIVEHDPERVHDKVITKKKKAGIIFRMDHPGYPTTMGVVELDPRRRYAALTKARKILEAYYAR